MFGLEALPKVILVAGLWLPLTNLVLAWTLPSARVERKDCLVHQLTV